MEQFIKEEQKSVTETQPQKVELFRFSKKMKILLAVAGTLIVIALLTLLIPKGQPTKTLLPSPSSISEAGLPTRPVSAFAQTQKFKDFEARLQDVRQQADSLDLTESQLSFPLLDMSVNYQR